MSATAYVLELEAQGPTPVGSLIDAPAQALTGGSDCAGYGDNVNPVVPLGVVGSSTITGSANAISVTLSGPVAAGDSVVLGFGYSRTATVDTVTISDTKGNSWTVEFVSQRGGQFFSGVAYATLATGLATGDIVTVTFAGPVTYSSLIALAVRNLDHVYGGVPGTAAGELPSSSGTGSAFDVTATWTATLGSAPFGGLVVSHTYLAVATYGYTPTSGPSSFTASMTGGARGVLQWQPLTDSDVVVGGTNASAQSRTARNYVFVPISRVEQGGLRIAGESDMTGAGTLASEGGQVRDAAADLTAGSEMGGFGGVIGGLGTEPYAPTVLASAPVSYWRLSDSAFPMQDSGSLGKASTSNTNVTRGVPGLLANDTDTAVSFAGSSGSRISFGLSHNYPGQAAMSLEVICRPSIVDSSFRRLFSKETGSSYPYYLAAQATGFYFTRGVGSTAGTQRDGILGGQPVAGQATHVVVTYDGALMRMYQDGVLVAGPLPSAFSIPTSSESLILGARAYDNSQLFAGVIDEPAIYDRALTGGEVAEHYAAFAAVAVTLTGESDMQGAGSVLVGAPMDLTGETDAEGAGAVLLGPSTVVNATVRDTATSSGGSGSPVIPRPALTQPGDTLLAFIGARSNVRYNPGTVTPSGWYVEFSQVRGGASTGNFALLSRTATAFDPGSWTTPFQAGSTETHYEVVCVATTGPGLTSVGGLTGTSSYSFIPQDHSHGGMQLAGAMTARSGATFDITWDLPGVEVGGVPNVQGGIAETVSVAVTTASTYIPGTAARWGYTAQYATVYAPVAPAPVPLALTGQSDCQGAGGVITDAGVLDHTGESGGQGAGALTFALSVSLTSETDSAGAGSVLASTGAAMTGESTWAALGALYVGSAGYFTAESAQAGAGGLVFNNTGDHTGSGAVAGSGSVAYYLHDDLAGQSDCEGVPGVLIGTGGTLVGESDMTTDVGVTFTAQPMTLGAHNGFWGAVGVRFNLTLDAVVVSDWGPVTPDVLYVGAGLLSFSYRYSGGAVLRPRLSSGKMVARFAGVIKLLPRSNAHTD